MEGLILIGNLKCMCVSVFGLHHLLFPNKEPRAQVSRSVCIAVLTTI